jgi:hypothetical protein
MWFVELLLLYSLAYAARARVAGPGRTAAPPSGRLLVGLGVAVAAASFVVRLVFPLLSFQVAHLNLWQWPQYVALFWLGTVGARGPRRRRGDRAPARRGGGRNGAPTACGRGPVDPTPARGPAPTELELEELDHAEGLRLRWAAGRRPRL